MPGDLETAVEHLELAGAKQHPHAAADQPGRHRVARLAHGDPCVAVGQRPQLQPCGEPLGRQRPQQAPLQREVLADGAHLMLDMAGIISQIGGGDMLVELGRRTDLGHRDQVGAAKPADLALDPTLGPSRQLLVIRKVRQVGCG